MMTDLLYSTIIYGVPVTKKNSQQILRNPRTGRSFIAPSAKYKAYDKLCGHQIKRPSEPISEPCNVVMRYYMPTHRRVDLVNLEEATLDLLVKYGVLSDDHSGIVKSHDGSRVLYDKENPRAEIVIERFIE